MSDEWTQQDETEFKRLNRKRMKLYRDRKRVNKYAPRNVSKKVNTN